VTERSKPYFVWRNEPLVGAPYDYGWFTTVVYPVGQDGKTFARRLDTTKHDAMLSRQTNIKPHGE
jgi:hypothetical protein